MGFLKPTGDYGVGSVEHELVDHSRPEHLASDNPGRRLMVKVWYPADEIAGDGSELLWAQLRRDSRTPKPMQLLLKCLRTRTSTNPSAPFSPVAWAPPLGLYNHGLVSFASENTSLMEELASHGHILIAIQHAEQLTELRTLNADQSKVERQANAARVRRLTVAPAGEKAKLALEYYEASPNTNRIVIERSLDTIFVLDHVMEVLARIPGLDLDRIDAAAANLLGFSVGGAVSTETARRDLRTRSVVNLDGGMHGTPSGAASVRQPYLMMYSSASEGINDELLPRHATRARTMRDCAHLNYHDIAMLLPFLRYLGVTGKTNARVFIERRNRTILDFVRPEFQSLDAEVRL